MSCFATPLPGIAGCTESVHPSEGVVKCDSPVLDEMVTATTFRRSPLCKGLAFHEAPVTIGDDGDGALTPLISSSPSSPPTENATVATVAVRSEKFCSCAFLESVVQ